MVRIVYSACLSLNGFCVNSLRWLARLLVCSLISTIPSFRSVYVSLWFAFPLQFIIKGDFDKCAGGFYKPHWPQRKSCPLTGAGHTSLYWLSCCQGYLTELWVSFIKDELQKPCFLKVSNGRSLTCRLIRYNTEFTGDVSTKNPNTCFAWSGSKQAGCLFKMSWFLLEK